MKKFFAIFLVTILLMTVCAAQEPTVQHGPRLNPKLAHFIGGGAITEFVSECGHDNWGLFAGGMAGIGKEIYDAHTEHESMNSHMKDIGITFAGSMVVWSIHKVINHYHHRSRD